MVAGNISGLQVSLMVWPGGAGNHSVRVTLLYGVHDTCDVYGSPVPGFVGINGHVFEYLAVWPLACLNV